MNKPMDRIIMYFHAERYRLPHEDDLSFRPVVLSIIYVWPCFLPFNYIVEIPSSFFSCGSCLKLWL